MDLDEYLWFNRKTIRQMAYEGDMSYPTLGNIKLGHSCPTLLNALKIVHISKGEITLEELLRPEDQENLKEWKQKICSDKPDQVKQ